MSLDGSGTPTLIESARGGRGQYLILAGVLGFILLPVFSLFEFYGPAAVPLRVSSDGLRVEDVLYPKSFPARDVDMTTLRAVDLEAEAQLKPVKRIRGVRSKDYRAGWFELADGGAAIVFVTTEPRAIYFWDQKEKVRVLISSAKPDDLIALMRSRWTQTPR